MGHGALGEEWQEVQGLGHEPANQRLEIYRESLISILFGLCTYVISTIRNLHDEFVDRHRTRQSHCLSYVLSSMDLIALPGYSDQVLFKIESIPSGQLKKKYDEEWIMCQRHPGMWPPVNTQIWFTQGTGILMAVEY